MRKAVVAQSRVMLVTGNQLRAARALIGMTQAALADAAGLHWRTVHEMEASGANEIRSGNPTILKVVRALDQAGVELLNDGQPGVQLKKPR